MTSKEALQDLRWNTSMSQDCNYAENDRLCDVIEKSLEEYEKQKQVLDILKKLIGVRSNINLKSGYDIFLFSKHIINGIYATPITKEQYELLKEWLEDND